MFKSKQLLERNPEAKARLLAANIVHLDLAGLVPSKREPIAQISEALPGRSRFEAGDWIETPKASSTLLVEWGKVDLVLPYHSGGIPAKRVGAGAVLGNVPALGLTLAGAKAIAAEDFQVVDVDYEILRALIEGSNEIAVRVLEMLGHRLAGLQIECGDIDSRLMRLITKLADEEGGLYGIASADLAVLLGVARRPVSEAIERLKSRGLIQRSRGRIKVTADSPG